MLFEADYAKTYASILYQCLFRTTNKLRILYMYIQRKIVYPKDTKNPTASTHRSVERPKISLSDMQTLIDEKALEFEPKIKNTVTQFQKVTKTNEYQLNLCTSSPMKSHMKSAGEI